MKCILYNSLQPQRKETSDSPHCICLTLVVGRGTGPAEPRMSPGTDGLFYANSLPFRSEFLYGASPLFICAQVLPYPASPTALSPPPPRHRQVPSHPDERRRAHSLSGESPTSENAESRSPLAGDDPPLTPSVSASNPTHASHSMSLPSPYPALSASTSMLRATSSSLRTPRPQSLNYHGLQRAEPRATSPCPTQTRMHVRPRSLPRARSLPSRPVRDGQTDPPFSHHAPPTECGGHRAGTSSRDVFQQGSRLG